jgi:hypothetical protein
MRKPSRASENRRTRTVFSDSGLAREEDEPAGTFGRFIEVLIQRREEPVALEQTAEDRNPAGIARSCSQRPGVQARTRGPMPRFAVARYRTSRTPSRRAAVTASPRVRASSLRRIEATWWSTVLTERKSRSAMSELRRPSARRRSTSSSRPVRPAALVRVARRGPRGSPRAPSSRRRRATKAAAGLTPRRRRSSNARRSASSSSASASASAGQLALVSFECLA